MKFKMAQPSYIENAVYAEGAELVLPNDTTHIPGPHWEPMDDAAKAWMAKNDIQYTGFVPDSIDKMAKQLEEDMARAREAGNPDKIGQGVVKALVEAGVIEKKPRGKTAVPAEI